MSLGLLGFALVTGGAAWLAYRYSRDVRIRREVAKLPLTPFREVVDGRRVKIAGVVELRSPPLKAPLSGRPCAAWSVVLQESDEGWQTIAHESQATGFIIVDDRGMSARVTSDRLAIVYEIDVEAESGWGVPAREPLRRMLLKHNKKLDTFFGNPRRYRAREGVIEHGERVTVVGVAHREVDPSPRAHPAAYREAPQRLVVSDGDGRPIYIIDGPPRPR